MTMRSPTPDSAAALAALRGPMREQTLLAEDAAVQRVLAALELSHGARTRARERATALVAGARSRAAERPMLDSFLQEFGLANEEGIALMCLAEALLRIPDDTTADLLIAEKLAAGDWSGHLGSSSSLFVNASTWALMLTGRLIDLPEASVANPGGWLKGLGRRLGDPLVRTALRRAMRIIGGEFVVGRTIEEALARSRSEPQLALCSFDMLGEGARTQADAERYRLAYRDARTAIGAEGHGRGLHQRSSLSIKLSALEPRYDLLHREQALARLRPVLIALARQAAAAGVGLTIDAEEADRLDLSLDLIEALARDASTRDWPGLGLAVQAYGKRVLSVIDWIGTLARETGRRMTVRLVKGAYWDAEIKRAQERGLASYPVYTRKAATDVSYLSGAARLLHWRDVIYPQFATHNAFSIAAILEMAPAGAEFEFQRLHGMGTLLYDEAQRQIASLPPIRAYAPVGRHEDLLAYLVRRLLENGANTSFVNRFMDERVPIEAVVEDPVSLLERESEAARTWIPLPADLYGPARRNSAGLDWGNPEVLATLLGELREHSAPASEGPLLSGAALVRTANPIFNPADARERVGECADALPADIEQAFDEAEAAQPLWDAQGAAARAACLLRAAEALPEQRARFLALLVREAGKTLPDALAEVREAEDFLRYYAQQARSGLAEPLVLPGPTGEDNTLEMHGRGVFACISPWNFPLAIFIGQIAAALVAGNAVVAKPAESTPLIAAAAVRLLHAAGVPPPLLQFMPGAGGVFASVAFVHPALAGVAFTGSTATALRINRALAARDGAIVPLIAETGGVNAMVVDSSALPEQVVDDVIASAFLSAGQRCSALRLLLVQHDAADKLIGMISGAMDALVIGNPAELATDIGPVIHAQALEKLERHGERMQREGRVLHQLALGEAQRYGSFCAPRLIELEDPGQLDGEHFGPILHVVRYSAQSLPEVIRGIAASGYGLTLGVHSRIERTLRQVRAGTRIGNLYVNRNMVGAVVGVQPFGGEGLSGTGPKAGGPHYLQRFATERTLSINTVATGGNARLLSLGG
jgi:RHH-type transcriptional regulator, proline utilization regulon repressor / proline dehydrogenase / delta 1-pyrroline-5-carboxylate dehydrogenase